MSLEFDDWLRFREEQEERETNGFLEEADRRYEEERDAKAERYLEEKDEE